VSPNLIFRGPRAVDLVTQPYWVTHMYTKKQRYPSGGLTVYTKIHSGNATRPSGKHPPAFSKRNPRELEMSVCFVYMRRGANSRLGMDHTRGDRGPSVHMEISNGAAAQGKKEGIGAQRVTLLCRPRKVPHPNRAENA